jgi:IstB-like ATP binding protein
VDLDGSRRVEKRMLHGGSGGGCCCGDFTFRRANTAAVEFSDAVRSGRVPGFQEGVDEAAEVAGGGSLSLRVNGDHLELDLARFGRKGGFARQHRLNGRLAGRGDEVDPIIATAILDRLLHHSTTINIRGESYRLKDRRKAGLFPRPEEDSGRSAPFPSPQSLQNGPRRQGSAAPRKTSAALTAPVRSTE